MDEEYTCFEHNKLEFCGVRIKPEFAKLINDTMYEQSDLQGAYGFYHQADRTYFLIYPESADFGDENGEHQTHMIMYKSIHMRILSLHPEAIEIT